MAISETRLQELAEKMARHIRNGQPARPSLRLVVPPPRPPSSMDPQTRESHLRMIRSLRNAYRRHGMGLLVDQATLGKGGLDDLSDDELIQLHRDLDRARECIQDDVTFEDAGLLRACGTGLAD